MKLTDIIELELALQLLELEATIQPEKEEKEENLTQ